nr:hypothetical protein [Candidatus Sigynarchaeum springense]
MPGVPSAFASATDIFTCVGFQADKPPIKYSNTIDGLLWEARGIGVQGFVA